VRNKKTGNSKGYCYIQFMDPIVAQIVADTMDGYIIFSHVLKCEVVSPDKYSPKFWIEHKKPLVRGDVIHKLDLIMKKNLKREKKRETRLKLKDETRKRKLDTAGISYELPVRYFNFQQKLNIRRIQENNQNTENQTNDEEFQNQENEIQENTENQTNEEFQNQENQKEEEGEGEGERVNSSDEGEMEDPK